MKKQIFESAVDQPEHSQCAHPVLVEEVVYGSPTGNYICMECECLITPNVEHPSLIQASQFNANKHIDHPLRLPAFII